jgi:hypothetical protein
LDLPNGISKSKLKSNGNKASPCFRPFLIGNASDKYLPTQNLLEVLFERILISFTGYVGTPKSVRILYNTEKLHKFILNHPMSKELLNTTNKPTLISFNFIYTEELADMMILLQLL